MSSSFELLVDDLGQSGMNEFEKGGEFFFGSWNFTCEMDVIVHEVVGVETNTIAVFVF